MKSSKPMSLLEVEDVRMISLADTVGMATPQQISEIGRAQS